jgi:hypothetical protein
MMANTGTACAGLRRRGVALLAAMICLVLAAAMLVSLVRLAETDRDRLEVEAWQIQAGLLADAGLERAAARLARAASYAGETWTIPPESAGGRFTAVVTIRVEPAPAGAGLGKVVSVEADYPDRPPYRAQETRQAVVTR